MLTEYVLISFIKPEVRKTLNINISGYVNNILIKFSYNITLRHAPFIYAINSIRKLVRLAQLIEQWTGISAVGVRVPRLTILTEFELISYIKSHVSKALSVKMITNFLNCYCMIKGSRNKCTVL